MSASLHRRIALFGSAVLIMGGVAACDSGSALPNKPSPIMSTTDGLPKPGTWRIEVSHAQVGKETQTTCMTEENIAETALFRSGSDAGDCAFTRRSMQNGKIDMSATCSVDDGGQMALETSGTYGPNSFDLDTRIKTGHSSQQQNFSLSVKGTHVSDTCNEDATH